MSVNMVTDTLAHLTAEFLENTGVDEGHNFEHVLQVAMHVSVASRSSDPPLDKERITILVAAGLLHDVDDRKFFNTADYSNARNLIRQVAEKFPIPEDFEDRVIKIIKTVSASENGSVFPEDTEEWEKIVRYCDILESIGYIGIARCYAYTNNVGRPYFNQSTPRPKNHAELNEMIKDTSRFENYVAKRGKVGETSMMDHYFDKLLHLKCDTDNPYIRKVFDERMTIMKDFVVNFGKRGVVNVAELEKLKNELL